MMWSTVTSASSELLERVQVEPPQSRALAKNPFRIARYITFESWAWRATLGLVALFDCATAVWLYCFREYFLHETVTPKRSFFRTTPVHSATEPSFVFKSLSKCTEILDRWDVQIGVLFSLLWFIDAFLKAQWKRDEKLAELDRQRIMGDNDDKRDLGGAWSAYYKTIMVQLLLLPVGFFVFIWYTVSGNQQRVKDAWINRSNKVNCMEHQNFTSIYSTHSLLYAFFHFHTMLMNQLLGEEIEIRRKTLSRRIIFFAIRRPFLFTQRLRIFFTTLRLTKYLGPLMGETAKFYDNASDLLKTLRQDFAVMRACRLRKEHWNSMNPTQRRDAAAVRIQSAVRGMQTRKTVKSFMIVLKARKERIARRLQKAVRASLVVSRTQHDLKRLELEKLEEEAKQAKQRGCSMSIDNRRRMYQLQDELEQKAKELVNKHLLLKPNTRFAVVWKVLFIFCVLLDISQQALQPRLSQLKDSKTGEMMNVEQFLEHHLVPRPMSAWESCSPWLSGPHVEGEYGIRRYFFRRKPRRSLKQPLWYCQEPYIAAQSIWIRVLRFLVMQAAVIIGIIRYVDVGVTFFIGEVHPKTGVLMPKSFVKRWIFPGLLLELLANPQMETTSKYLGRFLEGLIQMGPIRVGRWTLVGIYPLSRVVMRTVVQLWRPVVLQQNKECIERVAQNATEHPVVLTRSRSVRMISAMTESPTALIGAGLRRSHSALMVAAKRSSFALHELEHL
jgi:hypothetical protein